MNEPALGGLKPCHQILSEGRSYLWCSCGRSKRQPLCDGSHKGTGFEPIKYVAKGDEEVLFCTCKRTRTAPFCDGAHNDVAGGYRQDDPDSAENRSIGFVSERTGPRVMLDGGCYVLSPNRAERREQDGLCYHAVICKDYGAAHQSQFLVELTADTSPILTFGERHVLLFVTAGNARLNISGHNFDLLAGQGAYVRPSEAFQFHCTAPQRTSIFISACPTAAQPQQLSAMPANFANEWPERVARVDPEKWSSMAARKFQLLVSRSIGCELATQFIAHIPRSKAEPHRHLYEESILVLEGEGMLWTETKKAAVAPGEVIFLPRRQLHSLQATTDRGLDIVGVICPGDNPKISY